jgi:VWFA-related protein
VPRSLGTFSLQLSLFLLFLACADRCGLAQEQVPTAQLPPAVKVTVREVGVSVTVSDSRDNPLKGLAQKDFQVFDNGIAQPIAGFSTPDDPGAVVLLLETGPGAFFNQTNELDSASLFLNALPANFRVAIVSYSRSPTLIQDFTEDKASAREALAAINFKAGYAELNLVASLCQVLDWLASAPGKKTVVLLASGIDTTPNLNWPAAQQKISSSDVRVLAVSISQEIRQPLRGQVLSKEQKENLKIVQASFTDADRGLRQLAEPTGGRVYFPKKEKDFDHAFSEITRSIGHEYFLSLAPTAPDGQVHSINVKVSRPFSKLSFRQGYLVPLMPAN